jgi:hypothetical protein
MEKHLKAHGVSAVRFSAITEDVNTYFAGTSRLNNLNPAQISCLLSHLEIIRNYGLDEDLLVFEDDVDLSPSKHWGATFSEIVSCVDKSIGALQLYAHPSSVPVRPLWWGAGMFGSVAYFIKSDYAKKLVSTGYKDGKWDLTNLKSGYPLAVADSILYSSAPTISLTLFGLHPFKSNILPQAGYIDMASRVGNSWINGQNNIEDIKKSLVNFKRS